MPKAEQQCKVAILAINKRFKKVKTTTQWVCGENDFIGMYRFLHGNKNHAWQEALPDVSHHIETIKSHVEITYPHLKALVA